MDGNTACSAGGCPLKRWISWERVGVWHGAPPNASAPENGLSAAPAAACIHLPSLPYLPQSATSPCRFLPLLPPITQNVKLPIPTNALQFGCRARSTDGSKLKNGKNGNVNLGTQLSRSPAPVHLPPPPSTSSFPRVCSRSSPPSSSSVPLRVLCGEFSASLSALRVLCVLRGSLPSLRPFGQCAAVPSPRTLPADHSAVHTSSRR